MSIDIDFKVGVYGSFGESTSPFLLTALMELSLNSSGYSACPKHYDLWP